MFYRRVNALLFAVLAYLLSAWFFSFCVFCVVLASSRGADQGWMTVLLTAPAAVPMLALHEPDPLTMIWFAGVLGGSVVFYRVIRRSLTPPAPHAK